MQRYAFSVSPLRRPRRALAPRGQELDSLAGSDALRGRFFSWRGATGRRYVCSVFQRGEEGFVSDVESGVVIGVARDGASLRPVCLFSAGERRAAALRELAQELGVAEWHVHFCPDTEPARDLAGSLLN
ncbi:hypothetical protein [Methylocystis parvus]|uniref:Uncharacterized protein n=1 Tax=Methylocystis parvus TaxID=134 RepID=A0A6B8M6E6_9HYPH|nr:hypothetical protein [Methylocystis parvus]QGM96400.1 hypothetical protein F7D14_02135 [Methylocystis parvus]WBJ99757.1 hypothetical protein MMG94_17490 [Methylocystis parvus OBBP]